MRYSIAILICSILLCASCKESTTGLTGGADNLLVNSTFELQGTPSLQGWVVSDPSNVRFSTDTPPGGSGSSIVLEAQWFAPWPNGAIYQEVVPPAGTHRYRLSVLGKRSRIAGAVLVHIGRPSAPGSSLRMALQIVDTLWASSSSTDTITTVPGDSVYVTVSGGGTEILAGRSYFNTCRFEVLD